MTASGEKSVCHSQGRCKNVLDTTTTTTTTLAWLAQPPLSLPPRCRLRSPKPCRWAFERPGPPPRQSKAFPRTFAQAGSKLVATSLGRQGALWA